MKQLVMILLTAQLIACNSTGQPKQNIASSRRQDSLLKVLTYGLGTMQGTGADAIIASQYGFCYYPVAGCVVTKNLLDSINKENEQVYNVLTTKYGNNWKLEYSRKTDSLAALIKQVKTITANAPLVQKLNHQYNGSLYYRVVPANAANIFNVQAFSTGSAHFSAAFTVNLHTRQVKFVQ